MKKKINVFAFLFTFMCALLLGSGSPSSAHAETSDNYYDHESGYVVYDGYSFYVGDEVKSIIDAGNEYFIYSWTDSAGNWQVDIFPLAGEKNYEIGIYLVGSNLKFYLFTGGSAVTGSLSMNNRYNYKFREDTFVYSTKNSGFSQSSYTDSAGTPLYEKSHSNFRCVIASSMNVYNLSLSSKVMSYTGDIYYASDVGRVDFYSFFKFCDDASLRLLPSSATDVALFPAFNYNPSFRYIVTRIDGGYHLIQIYTNDGLNQFTGLASYGNKLYISVGEAMETLVNVRHFIYKIDGWLGYFSKTHEIKANDYLIDLGVEISEDNKLVYTSSPIKTGFPLFDVYYKSSEYDPVGYAGASAPVPNPYITPIPTPTITPGSGSSGGVRPGSGTCPDTGGQATGGGGLDFIINLFSMIWTKICSVPMAVDGYSISLQQIVIYGALVSIVGGFIMHFIFGRK